MDRIELADALYQRVFPITVVLCAVVGAVSFALASYAQSLMAFAAIGIAVFANSVVEQRRQQRSERLAGLGWTRNRSPVTPF